MASAYYSTVFTQPADEIWDEIWNVIRDFNSYPVWVDGSGESEIEGRPRLCRVVGDIRLRAGAAGRVGRVLSRRVRALAAIVASPSRRPDQIDRGNRADQIGAAK
jgi:hypothetical protein